MNAKQLLEAIEDLVCARFASRTSDAIDIYDRMRAQGASDETLWSIEQYVQGKVEALRTPIYMKDPDTGEVLQIHRTTLRQGVN